jgi:hypothetical protein
LAASEGALDRFRAVKLTSLLVFTTDFVEKLKEEEEEKENDEVNDENGMED